jgi:hypothetical protein
VRLAEVDGDDADGIELWGPAASDGTA